ncbi:Predicted homoserine dehydrogenase, contains C-terminal SAF domain [Hymenobacter daecheongensis DSM 21074]|uniref:Predicted homoserine dehydrogenase, contains C-terminal SAF domain n=1 Tax=Hymenobacter daecheongensis DSM 21074 TaxID=1121955 RepID=A0A1M6KLA0_9BACT|nr:Gfo/Idh/MocA family oxidoreductase [Hymenobacter daecheongensis]SHJ59714.1 Predicted homoserine dehydrogenase, contains C-terminal SAF domain [Hymenobacter daecheongensis DSM 21074]
MLIIDTALAQRQRLGQPIRVAMVGAGFMGRGVALQICRYVPGMELVAIANRTLSQARRAYEEAGEPGAREVDSVLALETCIQRGQPAITEDALLLSRAAGIDAIIEVTGAVEHGAHVVLEAIRHGKHVVLLNAELDGTVGAILKVYADRAGVVYTVSDGDQPGVTLNLARFVKGLGVKPVLCGNIKGLHDPYRNPTTQEAFARQWGQNPSMVTSFADGSKISFEQAVIANALGMEVAQRGMLGPTVAPGTPISKAAEWYPTERLLSGGPGIVDYVVGAEPGPGVFILGTHDDPIQQHYLKLYKLGPGPLYCFYTPYHLCHFETPTSVARAVLFQDAALAPQGAPCVEVITAAKIGLRAGDTLDGIGHYMTYGLAENYAVARAQNLLPLGVAEGCRLLRDIPKDQALTYDDVLLPEGRLVDQLRQEQEAYFGLAAQPSPLAVSEASLSVG